MLPYRIKVVEPIQLLPAPVREKKINEAGLNVFRLKSQDVYIDLLTDSGTSAMSTLQWSKIMLGDESYAGSESFFRLQNSVQEIFGLPFILPTHQGRAAEHLLDMALIKPGMLVPGNIHFDTTRAHIELAKGRTFDVTFEEGHSSTGDNPFKGNLDCKALEACIEKAGVEKIAYVLITITCNSNGGQPVSMENIAAVSKICRHHKIKLFFDAARFAENAFFIQQREKDFQKKPIPEIVQRMFSYVDGCTMSAKKDALVPMGGFLALRDESLFESLKTLGVLYEGFYTYGGLSGMDMEAMAQGLKEVIDENYIHYSVGQVQRLGEKLKKAGVPTVTPFGGHGIFIDGRRFYPNIPENQFPAQLVCVELYKNGGVRSVEAGACMAGRNPDTGANIRPTMDLCRMAIPRRAYTHEHLDYVADAVIETFEKGKTKKTGLLMTEEPSTGIRHFSAGFKYA
ncbi:MAG: tryptophanase [Deltaproteobacteria bacterium]|nr:tryptophanase [Deltaproteobacteria bacterium]